MTTLADLVTFLRADASLAGHIGNRLHPLVLPQAPTLPAMTFQVVGGLRQPTFRTAAGMVRRRVQFDVYASSYSDTDDVADALRLRLDGYIGAAGDGEIEAAMLEGERDTYESDVRAYRRSIDYLLWLEEGAT